MPPSWPLQTKRGAFPHWGEYRRLESLVKASLKRDEGTGRSLHPHHTRTEDQSGASFAWIVGDVEGGTLAIIPCCIEQDIGLGMDRNARPCSRVVRRARSHVGECPRALTQETGGRPRRGAVVSRSPDPLVLDEDRTNSTASAFTTLRHRVCNAEEILIPIRTMEVPRNLRPKHRDPARQCTNKCGPPSRPHPSSCRAQ